MTSETLEKALEREHGDIDRDIEAFLADPTAPGATAALIRATDLLRRHIYVEEALVFPPLNQGGMMAPLFVMAREHGEMWTVLEAIAAGLDESSRPAGPLVTRAVEDLVPRLALHNTKEEGIVYAQAEELLGASLCDELRSQLATAVMPDGWVCQRARVSG